MIKCETFQKKNEQPTTTMKETQIWYTASNYSHYVIGPGCGQAHTE